MYLLELGVAPKRNSRATDESQARTRSILLATARLTVTEKIAPISATFLANMHAFRASRRLVGECMMRERALEKGHPDPLGIASQYRHRRRAGSALLAASARRE